MKKILLSLSMIALVSTSAFAYINEGTSGAVKTLEKQGFSKSTLEVIDWVNYRQEGAEEKYVRRFVPKRNYLGRLYQYIKVYTDPIQDDGRFGDHHVEFSNTWFGNDVFYSSDLRKNKKIENL